jgi:hypothetical protein
MYRELLTRGGWTTRTINGDIWWYNPKTDTEVYLDKDLDGLTEEQFLGYMSAACFNAGSRWQRDTSKDRLAKAMHAAVDKALDKFV